MTKNQNNLGRRKCEACGAKRNPDAWRCQKCQHTHGWRGKTSLIVPVLSLCLAGLALIPTFWPVLFPKPGNLSLSGRLVKNSILEISVTNIGLGPVRISSIIHCDNENFSDRNLKPRTLTLESEMGNIEIIPPSSNGKIRYMFADYIEPRFFSNAPMGVHQNIVKALLENQYEILECKIVAEDDTGPLYDRSAHVIEIEKDKETGKLRGAFYEADVGP